DVVVNSVANPLRIESNGALGVFDLDGFERFCGYSGVVFGDFEIEPRCIIEIEPNRRASRNLVGVASQGIDGLARDIAGGRAIKIRAGSKKARRVGNTLGHMAPEIAAALQLVHSRESDCVVR